MYSSCFDKYVKELQEHDQQGIRPVPRMPSESVKYVTSIQALNQPVKLSFHPVTKPEHYNRKGIECIDAIEAALSEEEFLGYLRGNVLKYQWRCRYKGKTIEDIEKAEWYSNKLKQKLTEYGKA